MPTLTRRGFGRAVAGGAAGVALTQRAGAQSRAAAAPLPSDLTTLTLTEAADAVRGEAGQPHRTGQGVPRQDRRLQPQAERLHHRHSRPGAQAGRGAGAELAAGKIRGPLHGVPIALKDNIDTAGVRTTAASSVFDDRVPTEDAEVARRLAAAGAILLGKLNLHEFANGGTSATSYYGPVRNPWALDRNPGGSSGGSAAAVPPASVTQRSAPTPAAPSAPPPVLQRRRAEADLRPGADPRHHPARRLARPLRPDYALGGRRRAHAAGAGRLRPARHRQRGTPGRELRPGDGGAGQDACASASPRVPFFDLWTPTWPRPSSRASHHRLADREHD